jgi:uncharacterized protein involved in outer membrane biogenesis
MSKVSRKAWIGGAIVACVVLAAAAGVAMLLDANQHKSSIESAVSASLGLQFKIEGKASLHLFPHTYLTLENVHLSDGKTERLSAVSVQASPRWIPFIFHRKLSLESLSLDHPTMRVERNAVEASAAPDSVSGPGTMTLISIRQGDITFVDRSSASTVTTGNLDLTLSGITWSRSVPGQPFIVLKSLSLHGTLHAATLAIGDFKASNVQCQVTDEAGLLRLDSTDMVVFGGVSRGSLTIDLRGASPHLRLVQAASGIDLPKIFPVQIFVGKAQASLDIVGTGYDQRAIVPTMQGKVAIRSDHVTINSLDIDRLIADYERTQNFNLIDLASFVIVGPFAPLLTKGVDFSRLSFFGRLGNAKSEIR